MTWAAGVCAGFAAAGITHVVYVPDNPLSHVLSALNAHPGIRTTLATREEEAFGIAVGLYHCVNSGAATWEGLGQEIVRQLQVPSTLQPIGMADLQLRAPRPRCGALSNEKLRLAGFDMPTWQSAIERYLAARMATRKSATSGRSQPQ